MSEYTPPPNQPFCGDPKDPYVRKFLDAMGRQRQSYALQVVHLFVKAEAPPWLAEQLLAQLANAIHHVPPRMPHGAKLEVIKGDKE